MFLRSFSSEKSGSETVVPAVMFSQVGAASEASILRAAAIVIINVIESTSERLKPRRS
jgi:hypothetical protein